MYFSQLEKRAILTFANGMIAADGKVAAKELFAAHSWLKLVGYSDSDLSMDNLEASKAMTVISNLTYDEKRVVTSILITIMIADGNIDDKERAMINLITSFCDLPEMNAEDVQKTLKDLSEGKI